MATFIPGMTDTFAGSSPYTPDFNRIERMLKLRQNMYDQGVKQVKTVYDSLFNSSLMRDGNIQRRDAYLKAISESMNKLSATDLSLPQNVRTATELFTPLTTDLDLIKDIGYTKNYQTEMQRAESLRTSTDDATRKRYWSTGVKAMQYQAEEFKNASDEEARNMSNVKYTPNIDMLTIAQEAYKKAGISVKEDAINGGYIWTKKNGTSVFPVTQSYVSTLLGNDPGVADMLRVQAYVKRKDFVKQNASVYGGEEQAETAYIRDILGSVGKQTTKQVQADDQNVKELRAKKEAWDKKIETVGIVPGSDEHKQYLADLEKLQVAEGTVENNTKSGIDIPNIDYNNINELRQKADALVTFGMFQARTNELAQLLAFKDAELTVKADPISLAQIRADLSLRNQKIMESIRNNNRMKLEEYQIQHGKYKGKKSSEDEDETPDTDDVTDQLFNTNVYSQGPVINSSNPNGSPVAPNWWSFGGGNNGGSATTSTEEGVIKSSTGSNTATTETPVDEDQDKEDKKNEFEFGD